MNIMIRTQKTNSIFASALKAAFIEMGHDCIRSAKNLKTKRKVFEMDQEAIGKVSQFVAFQQNNVSTVPHTVNKAEALSWAAEGSTVVCRTLTNANSGEGIVLAETPDDVVEAPLYTKYIKKFAEYRVHVFNKQIIFIQQKKAMTEAVENGSINYKIRNHQFGWVFSHNDLEIVDQAQLESAAKAAIRATKYLYGAVDIIFNKRDSKYYVLEVNSRPGIEGATSIQYANAVLEYISQEKKPTVAGGIDEIDFCSAWITRCQEMKVEPFQIRESASLESYLRAVAFAYDKGFRSAADTELGVFRKSTETIELYPHEANKLNAYLAGKEGE